MPEYFSPEVAGSLIVPAEASSYGPRLGFCGDKRAPDPTPAEPYTEVGIPITYHQEPHFRFLGALDGVVTLTNIALHMSDTTYHAEEAATHEIDEPIMEALLEHDLWFIDHEQCAARGGRESVMQASAVHDPRLFGYARQILPDLRQNEYADFVAASDAITNAGRIHPPEAVLEYQAARVEERQHLPQLPMVKLRTVAGLHAVAMVVNRRPDTMLRPTELDQKGRPVRPIVYGIDAHVVDEISDALYSTFPTLDRRALHVATAVHAGVIIGARFITGADECELPIHLIAA